MRKLSSEDMEFLTLFEQLTGAVAKDCIVEKEASVFVVKEGDVGRAIGKNGSAIERVRKSLKRKVFIVEEASSEEDFVRNLFAPYPVKDLNIQEKNNERTAIVKIDSRHRGVVIGRGGERIKLSRALLQRHFELGLKLL